MSAPGTSRTHFREGNRLLRASSIVALVLLLPVTLALVMGASLIPFRFHVGRNFTLVFIKMLMPAFVWPLCWLGLLCAFAGLALAFYFWRRADRICVRLGFGGGYCQRHRLRHGCALHLSQRCCLARRNRASFRT